MRRFAIGFEFKALRSSPSDPSAAVARLAVAYVIAETCIDVKDGDCTVVCPVECIYEGGRMFYIQPDECVNCGICVSVCPVEAIFDERDLPAKWQRFTAINREFFGPEVTDWGEPGGLDDDFRTDRDHPTVAVAAPPGDT